MNMLNNDEINNNEKLIKNYKFHSNSLINRIVKYDYLATLKIYNLNYDNVNFYMLSLKRLIRILSFFGSAPFYVIMMSIIGVYSYFYRDQFIINFGAICLSGGIFLNILFLAMPKLIFRRKRPYANLAFKKLFNINIINRDLQFGKGQNQSFPSGHAFFWGFLLVVVPTYFGIIFMPLCLIILFLICFSRIYLGCHFVSDVIVGVFLGIISAMITIYLFDTLFYPILYLFYLYYEKIFFALKDISSIFLIANNFSCHSCNTTFKIYKPMFSAYAK
ncbi:MAG: phosphatase PAP2 family protein [Promethearchaeota archaeon]